MEHHPGGRGGEICGSHGSRTRVLDSSTVLSLSAHGTPGRDDRGGPVGYVSDPHPPSTHAWRSGWGFQLQSLVVCTSLSCEAAGRLVPWVLPTVGCQPGVSFPRCADVVQSCRYLDVHRPLVGFLLLFGWEEGGGAPVRRFSIGPLRVNLDLPAGLDQDPPVENHRVQFVPTGLHMAWPMNMPILRWQLIGNGRRGVILIGTRGFCAKRSPASSVLVQPVFLACGRQCIPPCML